jgi:hypothetical protein
MMWKKINPEDLDAEFQKRLGSKDYFFKFKHVGLDEHFLVIYFRPALNTKSS